MCNADNDNHPWLFYCINKNIEEEVPTNTN